MQIAAGPTGPELYGTQQPLGPALTEALRKPGPVMIMLHGFTFAPGHGKDCPFRHILSLDPQSRCWKALSWPREMGFGQDHEDEGLGIGFGWSARGSIWRAYRAAATAGRALAALVDQVRCAAPDRPVHLLAHSLGARVALSALPHLPQGAIGRMILLHPAEFGGVAAQVLETPAGRSAEVINITSRENDLFDFLLERFIAPPARGDAALAQAMPRHPNTLTFQIDQTETLRVLGEIGFGIAPPGGRICHWSAYLRPGVFDLYRALLRQPRSYPLARLRALLPDRPDPRWSRMLRLPELRTGLSTRQRAAQP